MAYSNNMTKLVKKIENRLGLRMLAPYLEKIEMGKSVWAEEIIIPDTLTTFSRYFPNEVIYPVNRATPAKDGWYFIDEEFIEGLEVLGIRDLDWKSFSDNNLAYMQESGYGVVDYVSMQSSLGLEDIGYMQMRKDLGSLFNNGIFIDFKAPSMFKLTCATSIDINTAFRQFKITLLVKHNDNLLTISPTMMEIFEELAISDVAGFIFRQLKFYDGLDTVYGSIDLKLNELEDRMNQRDSIIEKIKDNYVNAANKAIPFIMTI